MLLGVTKRQIYSIMCFHFWNEKRLLFGPVMQMGQFGFDQFDVNRLLLVLLTSIFDRGKSGGASLYLLYLICRGLKVRQSVEIKSEDDDAARLQKRKKSAA